MNIISKIKEKLSDIKNEREKTDIAKAVEFAKKNRNSLIVALDTKTDTITCAYQDIYMAAQIKSKYLGLKTGLVKHLILGHDKEKEQAQNMITLNNVISEFLCQLPEVVKNRKVGEVEEELQNSLKQLWPRKN